jgi:hypothetical protein
MDGGGNMQEVGISGMVFLLEKPAPTRGFWCLADQGRRNEQLGAGLDYGCQGLYARGGDFRDGLLARQTRPYEMVPYYF